MKTAKHEKKKTCARSPEKEPITRAQKQQIRLYRKKRQAGAAAVAVMLLAAALLFVAFQLSLFRITGSSMAPTLVEGSLVAAVKTKQLEQGDIIAFNYENKVLIKRVIAKEGDWVKIEEDGTVYVNEEMLQEPYVKDKSIGLADIEFPYQVPSGKLFVLGDVRTTSLDSRNGEIGCIARNQVLGKIVFRLWPIRRAGRIN